MTEINKSDPPINDAPVKTIGLNEATQRSSNVEKIETEIQEVTESLNESNIQNGNVWSNEDLIDLIRAVKFANKDASVRVVHEEITKQMASRDSFEYLSKVKLNDVKKVWKKALRGNNNRKSGSKVATDNAEEGTDSLPAEIKKAADRGGVLKFYTVGDGSVQSLAKDYTTQAAALIAAEKGDEDGIDEKDVLSNYVHCFLGVALDISGTRPHQALINFNTSAKKVKRKSGGKKGKKREKAKATAGRIDGENDDVDGRDIVKIQMAAPVPGMPRTPMLLYNQDRTAKTFIHSLDKKGDQNGDEENEKDDYDKVRELIMSEGSKGILSDGGSKAYFFCRITRGKGGRDIISIDVTSGLAPTQNW